MSNHRSPSDFRHQLRQILQEGNLDVSSGALRLFLNPSYGSSWMLDAVDCALDAIFAAAEQSQQPALLRLCASSFLATSRDPRDWAYRLLRSYQESTSRVSEDVIRSLFPDAFKRPLCISRLVEVALETGKLPFFRSLLQDPRFTVSEPLSWSLLGRIFNDFDMTAAVAESSSVATKKLDLLGRLIELSLAKPGSIKKAHQELTAFFEPKANWWSRSFSAKALRSILQETVFHGKNPATDRVSLQELTRQLRLLCLVYRHESVNASTEKAWIFKMRDVHSFQEFLRKNGIRETDELVCKFLDAPACQKAIDAGLLTTTAQLDAFLHNPAAKPEKIQKL